MVGGGGAYLSMHQSWLKFMDHWESLMTLIISQEGMNQVVWEAQK